jgi:DNA-directed RNA polymerase subunit F
MVDIQIISETPMNVYQLKKELERIKKRDNELNFRANRTEEYINQVITIKNADELFDKIAKLNIPRLKEQHIYKIIDIMPTTINELKTVLQGYTVTISNESMKKIVDTVNEFLEKK